MRALSIAWVNTKRFLRERSNVFFVFVFPLLIVLLIGVAFGNSFDTRVGLYVDDAGGPLVDELVTALEDVGDLVVERYGSQAALVDDVQRGALQGGVVVPAGYDATLRSGAAVEIGFVSRPDQSSLLVGETVRAAVVAEAIPLKAAQFVAPTTAFDEALTLARLVASGPSVTVAYREAGESLFEDFRNLGTFDLGAHQELVLFVFVTSLAGSAALIQTRQLGVARRMLSTPTPVVTILGGETLGRFAVAMVQGLYIMLGTMVVFGVSWGDPLGAIAILVVFSLVGAAAGMLFGSIFSNDQQAGGIGVLVGLGLAALGGAMAPVEIFPDAMKTIAKATPHAWAIDGYAELVRRGGSFVDILPNLGVLAGFAAAILAVGVWQLRRVLTH